jgi:alpha-beta hydrolase superfamily lysophospholipase
MQEEKSYAYVIERAEDGGYWAYFPDLPGCATTADPCDRFGPKSTGHGQA